jgi:hypothetical protein
VKYAVFGILMACHDRGAFRWEDNVCRGEIDSDDKLGRFERHGIGFMMSMERPLATGAIFTC